MLFLFLIGSCLCSELHLWQIQGHSGWSWSHPTWETADVCQGLHERPKETEVCRRQNGFGTGWAWVLWKVNYCSSYKSNCNTYYLQVDYSLQVLIIILFIDSEDFHKGLGILENNDLTFDLLLRPELMKHVPVLASKFPRLRYVLCPVPVLFIVCLEPNFI